MSVTIETNHLFVAGALACNTLLRRVSVEDAEGGSEILGWTILLIWSVLADIRRADSQQIGFRPWIAATGVALSLMGKSLSHVQWILPALSVSLYLARKFLSQSIAQKGSLGAFDPNSLPGQLLVAVLSLSVFLPTIPQSGSEIGLALLYLFACTATLVALLLVDSTERDEYGLLDDSNTVGVVRPIAIRTLPLAVLVTAALLQLRGLTSLTSIGITIIVTGALKALQWICLFSMTQEVPWDIAAPVSTFAATASLPHSVFVSAWHMAGFVIACLAHLVQIVAFLPSPAKSKFFILGFILIPSMTILSDTDLEKWRSMIPEQLSSSSSPLLSKADHPIEQLIKRSQADFSQMLKRQSKTVEDAIKEYRRRYDMDPPKGFEQWFEFAKLQDSALIDEFDSIYQSVSPFWKFPAATLRKNMKQAVKKDRHLFRCRYQDGEIKGDCGWDGKDIQTIMGTANYRLPDFDFVLSNADGPRVLMSDDIEEASQKVTFTNWNHHRTWKPLTAPCRHQEDQLSFRSTSNTSDISNPSRPKIDTHGLPFIQDIQDAHDSKDFCQHPEYADKHALFLSPADAKFTKQAVPVLSQAKGSTFSDILIPSVYYFNTVKGGRYNASIDPKWSQKPYGQLYWAGSNTGGLNRKGLWKDFQRHRFVSRTNYMDNESVPTYLAETEPGVWDPYQSGEHLDLFDVKFTAYIQCQPQSECKAQEELYGRHRREYRKKMHKFRLNADLDGNGYSGRWYSILRSHSTPFKQTLFREWHDERLYPWVHYVPMSNSFDEVPELARYFSQSEQGEKRAKRIANESTEWFGQAFRWADFQVYFYRLALEYARLLDDDREVKR